MNLIALQDEAVEAILSARPQGRRAACFGHTCCNRNPRVLRGIRARYERGLSRIGVSRAQFDALWTDVKDVAALELLAD